MQAPCSGSMLGFACFWNVPEKDALCLSAARAGAAATLCIGCEMLCSYVLIPRQLTQIGGCYHRVHRSPGFRRPLRPLSPHSTLLGPMGLLESLGLKRSPVAGGSYQPHDVKESNST